MQYASGEIERSMLKDKRDEVLKSLLKKNDCQGIQHCIHEEACNVFSTLHP